MNIRLRRSDMENFRIEFEGENGIEELFKKPAKHTPKRVKLLPFTTTKGKENFNDFDGVVGAFSRLLCGKQAKLKFDVEQFYMVLEESVDCNDQEKAKLIQIIKELYMQDNSLLPFNIKSLNYIQSDGVQEKLACFLFSIFESDDIRKEYQQKCETEDSNVLQMLLFKSLPELRDGIIKEEQKYECFLPKIKEVFQKDFIYLLQNPDIYRINIKRFLEYYFLFYIIQLAMKMDEFEKADREKIEKVYMTLSWEVTSETRTGYRLGWKYIKGKKVIEQLFSHIVTLEFLAHNNENHYVDYIDIYKKVKNSENDKSVAQQVIRVREGYKKWINMDFTDCEHNKSKDCECGTANEIRYLYETIDYQFRNGTRKAAYGRYSARFIEFVQSSFGKRRGALGYTFNITEQDIILFTQIILGENGGRVRLVKLFEEFAKRGLLFDRDSQNMIVVLFDKLNLLEKKSDSGESQYVKSIL